MTEQQTPDREKKIAEIREALESATPGSWKWVDVYKKNDFEKYNMGGFVNEEGKLICHFGNRIDYYPTEGEPPGYDDELLIANAPEWLRFLLSELERLERLNEMMQEEIRCQRAALEEVRECLDDFWDHGTPRRLYKEVRRFAGQLCVMEKVINQALSTATESTGQKDADDLIGDRIDERCPKCGADLLANKVGDKWCSLVGCDYSINAPEGGGNDA